MFLELSFIQTLCWELMAEPVMLRTVAHAPVVLHIAPMLELSPSLVSAAPTSLSVGAPRSSVEQYTPSVMPGFLLWTVELVLWD